MEIAPEFNAAPNQTAIGAQNDRRLLLGTIGYTLLAVVSFAVACGAWNGVIGHWGLRSAVPAVFQAKLVELQSPASGEPYDTLFLGSSRFYHGIDPRSFDQAMNRAGSPTHSFNLSFNGLNFPETLFLFNQVLSDSRIHLKNLIVEPSLRARLAVSLQNSERALTLHDLHGSLEIDKFIAHGNNDWGHKAYWAWFHVGVSATRLANVGALSSRLVRASEPAPDLEELLGPNHDGYLGLTRKPEHWPLVTSATLSKLIDQQRESVQSGQARRLNDYEVGVVNDLERRATERGMRFFLLMPPTADSDIYGEFCAVAQAKAEGRIHAPLLNLADPIAAPDMYDPNGFIDFDHLLPAQSQHLTQRVAEMIGANAPVAQAAR
jgi:hypothetical protein